MKSVTCWIVVFCIAALLNRAHGQCSRSFSVSSSTQLDSNSIFGSSKPQFSCSLYSYTYTAPTGRTLTLSCPSFFLSNGWFFRGSFGTVAPYNVKNFGTSFPTVTTTSNTLTVQWSSFLNTLPAWISFLWLQFSFRCVIQANGASPPAPVPPPSSGSCDCGTSTVADPINRIVGGQPATEGEFPYQARLLMSKSSGYTLCGGSLISNQWVVTAAHCFPRNGDIVYLGDLSITTTSANEQRRTVAQVILHPQYNTRTQMNDIAVVRLDRPVTFNNFVRAICLPDGFTTNSFTGTNMEVTGWGTTSEGGSASVVLQKVTLNVISNSACSSANGNYYARVVFPTTVCALSPGKDSCQGDSGGPLAYRSGGRSYLVGVVSSGNGCARPGFAGLYTRVAYPLLLQWVKTATGITCIAP